MNQRWLKARQTKYAAYVTVYILVIIAVAAVTNVLADRYNKSYDTTANKRYTLSDQTVKIVKGLKQDANITYYDQSTRFDQAKDLLDRYANLSPKVHVVYVDPDKTPQLARDAGITNYGMAIVQIGEKKENASGITEEGITGAFIRDLKNSVRTVCFVTGNGERQIDDTDRTGFASFKDLLTKDNYATKSIGLLEKAEVPADCTVVAIGGPTKDYAQPEVDAIKNYVENGGHALILLDPPLQVGQTDVSTNDALAALVASWGVTLNKDMVLDLNPVGQLAGLGPQVALVTSYETQPIVSEMKGTATGFPMSRSLTVENTGKTAVNKLFSSSDTSLATPDLHSASVRTNDPRNKKGPVILAAAGTYNTAKPDSQGRFVVVGGSTWVANSFINFNGNRDLAVNAVNWLSSDEDLISIRPKDQDDRRVTMTGAQLSLVRIWSQFLLPLAIVLTGAGVWWRRR
jgi:ABC-type uncharacterized transport system involved in gliding motility auxiliary subunit